MQVEELLRSYFPELSSSQIEKFGLLEELYLEWNAKVNLISRKDTAQLFTRHILHSLSIGCYFHFRPKTRIMDLGTGGGLPGLPLAILFPQCEFILIDSIRKKINVVDDIIKKLNLKNCRAVWGRAEEQKLKVDYVVTRAVAKTKVLLNYSSKHISRQANNSFPNGLIALKGGDLKEELKECKRSYELFDLAELFEDEFFETKKIVFIPFY